MLVIGLTGGIGAGKSVAAERFVALGVPVIDADVISRELVASDQPALAEIVGTFGQRVLQPDGSLNRAILRTQVFSDPSARAQLEAILHPRIRAEMTRQVARLTAPYCILVIPLLMETGQSDLVDRILVVDVDPVIQRERITRRDHLTEAGIDAVLNAQTDRETRLAAADDVIRNEGNLEDLYRQIAALHQQYLSLANAGAGPRGSR